MQKSHFQNYTENVRQMETSTIIKETLFFLLFVKEQLIHFKKGTHSTALFLIFESWMPVFPCDKTRSKDMRYFHLEMEIINPNNFCAPHSFTNLSHIRISSGRLCNEILYHYSCRLENDKVSDIGSLITFDSAQSSISIWQQCDVMWQGNLLDLQNSKYYLQLHIALNNVSPLCLSQV